MSRLLKGLGVLLVGLFIMLWVYWPPINRPVVHLSKTSGAVPKFSHVFVIMMENHGVAALKGNPNAPYINQLMHHYGYANNYFGVTHVSLPNYVAFISGKTTGSHSDNPAQAFFQPTLVGQLNRHRLSWQGVMQSLPHTGYLGYWYPAKPHLAPATPPHDALYAKKHNPFLLFPKVAKTAANHIVGLQQFDQELRKNAISRFTWITPNLCNDMHGQIPGAGASCPENHSAALVRSGDRFLHRIIPRIMHSPAWTKNSVIFVTWDEAELPAGFPTPGAVASYLSSGPGAPPIIPGTPWLGRLGGGRVPLIVITPKQHSQTVSVWSDHYSVLKTIEESWHLRFLGHAKSPRVPVLWQFFSGKSG